MKAFISSLSFKDSKFSQVDLINTGIEVIGSQASFENIQIDSIQSGTIVDNTKEFILGLLESTVILNGLEYSDSNSLLLKTRTSKTYLSRVSYTNINGGLNLFEISENTEASVSEISINNVSIGDSNLFLIKNSEKVSLTDINIEGSNKTVFLIKESHVPIIRNITIKGSYKGMKIVLSTIDMISNSTFEGNGNIQRDGGGLQISDSVIKIRDTKFLKNLARAGSGISFSCSSMILCSLDINDVIFQDNKAGLKGGSIYYDYARPIFGGNVTHTNNTAQYGNNIASYPIKIAFKDSPTTEMKILNLGSGIAYEKELELALFDADNQIMTLENAHQIILTSIVNSSQATVRGFNSAALRKGIAKFDNFIVVAQPGMLNIFVSATSKAIDKNKLSSIAGVTVQDDLIEVGLRY